MRAYPWKNIAPEAVGSQSSCSGNDCDKFGAQTAISTFSDWNMGLQNPETKTLPGSSDEKAWVRYDFETEKFIKAVFVGGKMLKYSAFVGNSETISENT